MWYQHKTDCLRWILHTNFSVTSVFIEATHFLIFIGKQSSYLVIYHSSLKNLMRQ